MSSISIDTDYAELPHSFCIVGSKERACKGLPSAERLTSKRGIISFDRVALLDFPNVVIMIMMVKRFKARRSSWGLESTV